MSIFKKSYKINSLPNYTTAGSYCFISQCILLNSVTHSDLKYLQNSELNIEDNFESIFKFAPLLTHELKHWYDAHSTLWGLKLFLKIYTCRHDLYEAEKNGISTQLPHFYKQKQLFDSIENLKFPSYYLTRNPDNNNSLPWGYKFSAGIMFDKYGNPSDRNIFFTRFENAKGQLISRVPFSLCSLLEASAVAEELNSKNFLISAIQNPVTLNLEKQSFKKSTIDELYNEQLVEYSVVAHKIANAFQIQDALEAYNIANEIVTITLNLTDDVIDKIEPNRLLSPKFLNFFEPYKNALKYKDYGAIFSLIIDGLYCTFQEKGEYITFNNLNSYLQKLFTEKIGFSLEEVFQKSINEVESICIPQQLSIHNKYVNQTLSIGKSLHQKRLTAKKTFLKLKDEFMPDFILGDDTFISSQGNTKESFEDRYIELNWFFEHLSSFSEACIV